MSWLLFVFSLIAAFTYPLYDTCLIKEIIFLPVGFAFLTWAFFEKKDWLRDPGTWLGLWLVLNVYTINGEFLKWLGCLGIYFYIRQAKNVRWVLVLGWVVIALYNLYLLHGNYGADHWGGSLVNGNIAGGFWLLYFFFFLSLGWAGAAGSAISLYFLFISSCRGSRLGLSMGLLALITAYRPRLGSVLLILSGVGALWYYASLGAQPCVDRYLFYQSAFDMVRFHWIAGSGTGSFAAIFPVFADPGLYAQYGVNFYLSHVHNFILELWAEQGVIGVGLFVWLMIWSISRAISFRSRVLSAGVIGMLAYSWTSVGLNYVPVLPLFFVMLALIGKEKEEFDDKLSEAANYFYNTEREL